MRKVVAIVLYLCCLPWIYREVNKKNSILAIYGHDNLEEPFEKLVCWFLKKGYRFISPTELYDYLSTKRVINEKLVWLSFDDGWKSNYECVFPILKKYNIPATIFISTKGIFDGYYWFTRVFQNRRSKLYNEVDELWQLNNRDRVRIVEMLPSYQGERLTMNSDEIKEMDSSGIVYWGNHTHDHVISDNCTAEELVEEITKCNNTLKDIIGKESLPIYSYPNGNYDDMTLGVIQKMNFMFAVTTNIGRIDYHSDIFKLSRNEFKNGTLAENILQSFGIWTHVFNFVKKLFFIKNKK